MLRTSSPILKPIRDKVEAGERLSLDDGLVLERPDVPLPEVGELANLVRERKNGNCGLLQHQHAPQPDERLRLSLRVLRVPLRPARPEGLRDERRADPRPRGRGGRQRLHRDAHRRRPAPPDEVRLVRQRHPHPARGLSRAAPQGLDARRDRLVLPAGEEDRPRDAAKTWSTPASAACPAAGPRSFTPKSATRSASTRPTPAAGSKSTARPTSSACAPTARCSTATSSSRTTASTT